MVVFLTEKYRDKINSGDGRDNCKYEFQYAFEQLGSERMIPVVMDPSMKNLSEWTGVLGAAFATGPPCLRGEPYLDLTMDEGDVFNDQCVELARMIQFTMQMVASQEQEAAAAAAIAAAGNVEGGRSSSFSGIVSSAVAVVGLPAAAVSAVVALPSPPPPPPPASTPHRTSRRIIQHMQLQQEQQQQRASFSSNAAGGAGGELQLLPTDDNDHDGIFSDVDSDGDEPNV